MPFRVLRFHALCVVAWNVICVCVVTLQAVGRRLEGPLLREQVRRRSGGPRVQEQSGEPPASALIILFHNR